MSFQSLEDLLGPVAFARFLDLVGDRALTSSQVVARLNAEGIGVGRSSVLKYRAVEKTPPTTIIADGGVLPTAVQSPTPNAPLQSSILLRENARLKRALDEREAGWEIIRDVLESVYEAPSNIQVPVPKLQTAVGSAEVAVLHLTDLHIGKRTRTYSLAVAEARLIRLVEAITTITSLRQQTAPITKGVVLLGGDFVEGGGNIFPSQPHELDVDLVEQMIKSGPEAVAGALIGLGSIFTELHIAGAPGNHGRQGKFSAPRHNADSIFYSIVQSLVKMSAPDLFARITWDLPFDRHHGEEWFARFPIIGSHAGLLVHGDQIRGGFAGFPWYAVGKKVAGWNTSPGTAGFNYFWMGHFHTPASFRLNRVHAFATGSLESDNQYALENMASGGTPTQRLTFFNERYGMLADHLIELS